MSTAEWIEWIKSENEGYLAGDYTPREVAALLESAFKFINKSPGALSKAAMEKLKAKSANTLIDKKKSYLEKF